jgi:predicted transcriptional regulator
MAQQELTLKTVLKLLANPTRREILQNLARGNKYILQLTEDVNAPQQSIIRHLRSLEKQGIVESYKEKSELGGPPRRYYRLIHSFLLSIDLTSHSFTQKLVFPKSFESLEAPEEIDTKRMEDLTKIDLDEDELAPLSSCLFEIDKEIAKVEKWREYLVSLRQIFLDKTKSVIEKYAQSDIEKDALYLLLGKQGLDKEKISEMLDIREKRIEGIFDELQKRSIVDKDGNKKWDFSS